jgi:ubiquinone biosynthesis accessory factor UbiJ
MSFALLQSAMLLPVELAINQVLALDAASGKRLAALEGRSLAVQIKQPAFTLYVQIYGNKLHLSPRSETEPTTTLSGSAPALAGLLLRGEALTNLQAHNVELRGDLRFAQQLQALLQDLKIDWEFHLSRFIGDIPTQAMADGVHTATAYARQTSQRVRDDVRDFLLEESRVLPSTAEFESFYDAISALGLRVDRAAARIALLES